MAPVTELAAMLGKGASSAFGEIISAYLYTAYHRLYPDVGDAYISRFHAMVAKDISRRCILDWRAAWSLALTRLLPDEGLFLQPISDGPFGDRLAQNDPTGAIDAPLLLAQGLADEVIVRGSPEPGALEAVYPCFKVLPMGWKCMFFLAQVLHSL